MALLVLAGVLALAQLALGGASDDGSPGASVASSNCAAPSSDAASKEGQLSPPTAEELAAERLGAMRVQAERLGDAIMGPTLVSADDMAALYESREVSYPADAYAAAGAPTITAFCQLCIEEAEAEEVRAEVVFAQAMHETGWLQFGNQVSAEQCNFGGLGAVNSGGAGERFANVREGLRAQVQHLKAYASTDPLARNRVDTRFDLVERGSASKVGDLGGKWAWPGEGYGDAIMAIVAQLYESACSQLG